MQLLEASTQIRRDRINPSPKSSRGISIRA
jgi:hypothetical protein